MATVLLLRHGRTTSNADGTLAGSLPVALDELGRTQAQAVGVRLAGVPLADVVSSPLPRCRETLDLALPGVKPTIEPRLAECGYGTWEGRPLKELAKEPLWRVVQQHPSAVTFPDGEGMAAMSARAVAAVRERSAELPTQAIWLACSHGDVIKAIVADALGLHLDQFQRIAVDPGSLTVIRYTETRPFLVRLNDSGASLTTLVPKRTSRRRRAGGESDAAVGGGAGGGGAE